MKIHVVNILPHQPDYDYLQDEPRPEINWDTSTGDWVGIYRNEIPDKLGGEILKHTRELEYEVWQPDYKADKMYSHRFDDGLVHRLFPAKDIKESRGLRFHKQISSPNLVEYLVQYSATKRVVVNINGGFFHLNTELLKHCGHLPILQTFRGTMHLPKSMIFKKRLNVLAGISYFLKHLEAKRLIKQVDYVMYMNDLFLDDLKAIYKGPLMKLTTGCDFGFWKKTDKTGSREALDMPKDKIVFLTSSLLIPLKQVDKIINIFLSLDEHFDFLLILTGHGTNQYESYLKELAKPLIEKGKVRFPGYVTGETLRNYYNSADVFINSSVSEGGPVSAMKAAACGTPLFSTVVGNVAERMRENKSGVLVGIHDYDEWARIFKEILNGRKLKPFDRKEAEEHYDWQKIAQKFMEVYKLLDKKYNSQGYSALQNA